MKKYLFTILAFSFFLFSFGTFSANAQVQSTDISLQIFPSFPAPNQNVKATLTSQALDLNKTLISWSLNGETKLVGIGKKDFEFSTGDIGTVENISASIDTVGGNNIIKTLSVRATEIDMLWEASDSYLPPFYKGKALPVSQGKIKVVAVPSFVNQDGKVSANNLTYAWKKDGKGQLEYSGWGKNYFLFQNNYLDKQNTVNVKVSDILGSMDAGGSVTVENRNPKIVFYKMDSNLGVLWEKALTDGFSVGVDGETIVAEPYFFSRSDISSPDISFVWSLNGQSISTPEPKNILSVKLDTDNHGTAIIKTAVENIKTLFQSAEKQINVSF